MQVDAPPNLGHVRIELDGDEILHLLHPKALLAFQGDPRNREDRLMNLSGMYRKRKLIQSQLRGSACLILGITPGCMMEIVDIPEDSNLLFDFRHVLFYTNGMTMKSQVQSFKNIWITHELVRIQFSGPGRIGLLSSGSIASLQLDPNIPLFVETGSLVAYPGNSHIKLSVYGNPLATQNMNVQWEMTGDGPILMQTGFRDHSLEDRLHKDSFIRRTLREILPFGGIYIR